MVSGMVLKETNTEDKERKNWKSCKWLLTGQSSRTTYGNLKSMLLLFFRVHDYLDRQQHSFSGIISFIWPAVKDDLWVTSRECFFCSSRPITTWKRQAFCQRNYVSEVVALIDDLFEKSGGGGVGITNTLQLCYWWKAWIDSS